MGEWKKEEHKYWPIQFKKIIFIFLLFLKRMKNEGKLNIPKVIQILIIQFISYSYY